MLESMQRKDCLHCRDAEFYFRGESMNFKRKDEGTDLPLGTAFPSFIDREKAWWQNERDLYQEALRNPDFARKIDMAVMRILKYKIKAGLLDGQKIR